VIRPALTIFILSVCLLGEQRDSLIAPKSQLIDTTSASIPDTLTVDIDVPRQYEYRYQIVSGVAMMLFFGLALGTSQSMNPN